MNEEDSVAKKKLHNFQISAIYSLCVNLIVKNQIKQFHFLYYLINDILHSVTEHFKKRTKKS